MNVNEVCVNVVFITVCVLLYVCQGVCVTVCELLFVLLFLCVTVCVLQCVYV